MMYECCHRGRLEAVREDGRFNAVELLEVIDRDLPLDDPLRQHTLLVRCLLDVEGLTGDQVRIEGGERIRGVRVLWAAPATPMPEQLKAPNVAGVTDVERATRELVAGLVDPERVLVVRVDRSGDFSTYRLRVVAGLLDDSPPDKFDARLCDIDFSFRVECPSDFDCKATVACQHEPTSPPVIDYLAKDYGGFRRLLLDRLAATVPAWKQSSVADTGIAVAELLAYVGDQLSYWQDAVATEAYLETARRRISLRRHAHLVDYPMHDGCNARAWVHVTVATGKGPLDLPADGVVFLTGGSDSPTVLAPESPALRDALLAHPQVFESMHPVTLRETHNRITFHTWSDDRCCLPRGATRATLKGWLPELRAGDVLLFEEVVGPLTGATADADPLHRQLVRLTSVQPSDPAVMLTDPLTDEPITEIEWHVEDALRFPLCLSSITDAEHGSVAVGEVSVARGNMILVDHGATRPSEDLGIVPGPRLFLAPCCTDSPCARPAPAPVPARYSPRLSTADLTQAGTVSVTVVVDGETQKERRPVDPAASVVAASCWNMSDVVPAIELRSLSDGRAEDWSPQRTLLRSAADATDFVVEVDDEGVAQLRFGDDACGRRPERGTSFSATYRVGNGAVGNVGAGAIRQIVSALLAADEVAEVRNPLPAAGGRDPETAASVRRNAPVAFRTQERAVTEEDYAVKTESFGGIQRAAATLRWTGSWHTVFVTVDREGGVELTPELEKDLSRQLDRFRMAGHDLEFDDPVFVPLEIELHVCVAPDYFRADVKRALLEVFTSGPRRDGQPGLFHPDRFIFGQPVYLGPLYAAAHDVPGVASAEFTVFGRQGDTDTTALEEGQIRLGRLEVARLDNNADFPERGVFRLHLDGGK
jgi:baseplate J-like protein